MLGRQLRRRQLTAQGLQSTFALKSAEYRFRLPVIGSVLQPGRTKLKHLSQIPGAPQSVLNLVARVSKAFAASCSAVHTEASPIRVIPPVTSVSPD